MMKFVNDYIRTQGITLEQQLAQDKVCLAECCDM